MPTTYAYRVRDRQGRTIDGTLEADTESAAATRLRQLGYAPLTIAKSRRGLRTEISLPWGKRVKLKDLAILSRQFSTMLGSGLSLMRSLAILAQQTENKHFAQVITTVRGDVESGTSLSAALSKHPKVFNRLYVSMTRAGESGGFLDASMLRVADTLEAEVELRGKIRSAMTYPVVVFSLVILVVAAMLVFVVPTFSSLFGQLGGTLPLPTRILVAISKFARWGIVLAVPVGFLGLVGYRRWSSTPEGRRWVDTAKLRMPVFGQLVHKTMMSRFSRTLATLTASGVPILQALDIVAETVGNSILAGAIKDVQDSVREGESLATPLAAHKAVFPPMVVQMMSVGEETGALDTMLGKVADFYDQEVETAVESLTSMIEPILIAVMGVIVGGMVVALYLPLFSIINLIE